MEAHANNTERTTEQQQRHTLSMTNRQRMSLFRLPNSLLVAISLERLPDRATVRLM